MAQTRSITSRNIYLLLIVFAAVVLRVYGIQSKGLWADEAYSVSFLSYSWQDIFQHRYLNRPLYFLILKGWSAIFGTGEVALRLPAAIFGAMSVPVIYILAKRLCNVRTALIAAMLLAVSPFHIYWSQEVRNLTAAVFFALLNMYYFVGLITDRKRSDYLGHALSAVALFLAHPMGLYLLPAQYLYARFFTDPAQARRDQRHWLILLALVLPILWLGVNDNGRNFFVCLPRTLFQIFETFNFGGPCQAHGQSGFVIAADKLVMPRILNWIFALFFILGMKSYVDRWRSARRDGGSYWPVLILLWLVIPVLVPAFLLRHTIIALPAYYLIVAEGWAQISQRKLFAGVVIVVVLVSGFALKNYYSLGSGRLSWREAGAYVYQHSKKDDVLVFVPSEQLPPFFYYFGARPSGRSLAHIDRRGYWERGEFKREFTVEGRKCIGVDLYAVKDFIQAGALDAFAKERREVWLILSPYWTGTEPEAVKRYFEQYYSENFSMIVDYNGVEVRHYTPGQVAHETSL
ncbi:MAG: hypothetical protein HGA80_09405 [Candidatus Omnitrophica bacterium]|nr:hypothetical protein [Candidatus Omnitrophota bacterium]